ncbi:Chemotaxis protein CheV [Sulfidibacter corallicola]|uniref:Chemotaxis protein CheV n=1 Tax=Sulfidibacter corallicola TaxID=2818388 RepID=A0A8A4TUK7_SULCO|nr:chemotaxis protein [Sulfidibacter corallicola]QTD52712.1 chemotaxis protein CheV [Sulfidibacter corallicola]
MSTEILLEVGTNEVEFLEFFLGDQSYGINVAKVRQLLKFEQSQITTLPCVQPSVLGSLLHLERHLLVVDLNMLLNDTPSQSTGARIVIVTDFNDAITGFVVDGVSKIYRLSWEEYLPLSNALQRHNPRVTGVVVIEKREVLILDFEQIIEEIRGLDPWDHPLSTDEEKETLAIPPSTQTAAAPTSAPANVSPEIAAATAAWRKPSQADPSPGQGAAQGNAAPASAAPPAGDGGAEAAPAETGRGAVNILFAEDSKLFRLSMLDGLRARGFTQVQSFENGSQLLDFLRQQHRQAQEEGTPLRDRVQLIMTDIEMPIMDGLTLCKAVKEIESELPIVVLSSLITDQMRLKCESVGANAAISKKNLPELMKTLDRLVEETVS